MTITIEDFVAREVIYCVSLLVYTLTQENKLDEELEIQLWTGPINYDDAEYAINNDGSHLAQKDNLWGLYDNDDADNPIVNYEYETKEALIEWYFDDMGWNLSDYRSEVFEHWLCTTWLADKLEAQGETVVRNFYGLEAIWCRSTTNQAIYMDYVIQQIYNNLKYK